LTFFLAGLAFTVIVAAASAGNPADEAIEKGRQECAGRWRATALEVDGVDWTPRGARPFTLVMRADGSWSLRYEKKELSKGTSTIDPTKKPKTIDFWPRSGLGVLGKDYPWWQGVYEIGPGGGRLCFASSINGRPAEFSGKKYSKSFLVRFEPDQSKSDDVVPLEMAPILPSTPPRMVLRGTDRKGLVPKGWVKLRGNTMLAGDVPAAAPGWKIGPNRGVADVVVWLRTPVGWYLEVPPPLRKPEVITVRLDQPAFGNKEPLFRKALDRYETGPMSFLTEALRKPTARAVVEAIFSGFIRMQRDRDKPRGLI
jgi:uncharacterized protein (TIGR03067 family)